MLKEIHMIYSQEWQLFYTDLHALVRKQHWHDSNDGVESEVKSKNEKSPNYLGDA